jgi:hypothetical protein
MTPDKIELVHDGSVRMTVPCTQHRPDLASSALEWIGAKPEAGRGSKKLGTKHPHGVTAGLFAIVQDSFEKSRKETSSLSSVSAGFRSVVDRPTYTGSSRTCPARRDRDLATHPIRDMR